jgi:PAS domain S-box-containing protein
MGQVRHVADDPEAREFLRLLAQVAPVGIVQTDSRGECVFVNDRWCALTGTTVAEALKAGWSDALHPGDIERVAREWFDAASSGTELRTECRLKRAGGGEIWVYVAAVPLPEPGGDGEPVGYLAAITNISERKRAEAEQERLLEAEQRMLTSELAAREMAELAQQRLVEQNVRLMELDEARRQFLAMSAHELSTPITAIISFAELIRGGDADLSPDTAESIAIIARNARRLIRVVDDLMLVTRIEAGGLPLDLAPVAVPDIVNEAVSSAAPEAAKKGIQIEVSAQDGPPVQADQFRLSQLFDNLLSNAVKFTAQHDERDGHDGPPGRVQVTATHDDRAWQVEIEDSGIGIPASELGEIFDRFARASNARAASLPGSGLGLSVVKAIAELHGGRVEADSVEGHGTTFRVYLPIAR